MTHPHHPWCGRTFEVVSLKQTWGEDRVYFHDAAGHLCALPVRWTSLAVPDAFVMLAAGRAWFRVADLTEVAELVARLTHGV